MLDIQIETPFDFRSEEYHRLYDSAGATAFQHPVWLHHLYADLAPRRGADPLVVTGRDAATGRLLLVLPLVRRRTGPFRRIEFADLGVSDYASPVVDGSLDVGDLVKSGVPGEIRRCLGRYDLLRIDKIAFRPDEVHALLGTRRPRRHRYGRWPVPLDPPTFDDWTASLDPAFARHLVSRRKKLRPKGVIDFRELTDPSQIADAFDDMRRFRADRFADRRAIDLVQDPDCFDFYLKVAQTSAAEGGPGRTAAITVDDAYAAVSFGLLEPDRLVWLLVGYDFNRYKRQALGLLVVEDEIRASYDRGERVFDLTLGDEPYKASFGAVGRPVSSTTAPRTARGLLLDQWERADDRGRAAAKRAVAYKEEKLDPLLERFRRDAS
ncbi:GNAT family N-acetyltransferase [Mumia zhuanghuii]|uniref:GNAT family N-acetyltransferase n=2 Tax=Mumia TaxID=1546255 RepID=A0ABW1QH63_9ACTN|nr:MULTISPECIES: GNAT family N-acetyltransferase [Mumia]KAA1422786.1 GNAT family N-acetyltransferase [Mumia zhuanghuii]